MQQVFLEVKVEVNPVRKGWALTPLSIRNWGFLFLPSPA